MTDIIIQGIGGRMGHALCEMIANRISVLLLLWKRH